MSLVTERANQLDDERAIEAMQGALSQSADHMTKLVLINSVWDDAVRKVYSSKLDKAWLYASYRALATPGNDYDNVYIIDEKGVVLWSHSGFDVNVFTSNGFTLNDFQTGGVA